MVGGWWASEQVELLPLWCGDLGRDGAELGGSGKREGGLGTLLSTAAPQFSNTLGVSVETRNGLPP